MGSWAEHKYATCYVMLIWPYFILASADSHLPCVVSSYTIDSTRSQYYRQQPYKFLYSINIWLTWISRLTACALWSKVRVLAAGFCKDADPHSDLQNFFIKHQDLLGVLYRIHQNQDIVKHWNFAGLFFRLAPLHITVQYYYHSAQWALRNLSKIFLDSKYKYDELILTSTVTRKKMNLAVY